MDYLLHTMHDYTIQFAECKTVNDCLKLRDSISSSGRFSEIKTVIKSADAETKKALGEELTQLNKALRASCDIRIIQIQQEQEVDTYVNYDPTFVLTTTKNSQGSLHPITEVLQDIVGIFQNIGFTVADGPLVESQWYNFTALNTPDYHPARAMQDTFFVAEKDSNDENYVMRTQTSGVQIRYGEKHEPPFRIVVPGIVYRNEDIDATHDINFHQMECLVIDKNVSVAHLVTLLEKAFTEFYRTQITVRMRPSYFPFVNPGMEGDISCPFCQGKGCRVCKQTGWIECFGAGLVHPKVITNMGLNSNQWQGLAFGFGIDRLAQLKLSISGISQFYNGNLDFLKAE